MPKPCDAHRRVAFVVESQAFGGAEVYVEHLLRHLPPEIPRVLFVRAPAPPQLLQSARTCGVDVVVWHGTPRGLLALHRGLRSAGLVHVNLTAPGYNRHAIAGVLLCRRPVVATVHLYLEPGSPLKRRVLRLAYRRFSRVIAVSADIEQALVSRLGVPRDRVRLVPNGVEALRAPGPPASASFTSEATVAIGGMGRLTRQKGFDLLIEAARRLVMEGHSIEVLIAGDGPERANLEAAARDLPVRFLGKVGDTTTFLHSLDVFCLPSRWEGLPFALLEAMMAGKACVAAAVGDVPVALGSAGIVVAKEDVDALVAALRRLVVSGEGRRRLGEAAHRRAAEEYGIDHFIERTLAVYSELGTAQPST